jgi:hypothetical protein
MFLQELSHILVAVGISTSQEEHILTTIKNLFVSPQEDLEVPSDSSCQFVEETKESWIEFNGEQPMEHDIEEFLSCLLEYHVCTPKKNHLQEDNLRNMEKEDMLCDLKKNKNKNIMILLKDGSN